MTSSGTRNGDARSSVVMPIHFDDFPVSWAGQGGREDDFCFGSEDGRLRFTNVDGERLGGDLASGEEGEAVNGVAFIGPVIAVSSRKEVIFWTLPKPGSLEAHRVLFNCGAHGVIATAEGYFIAPLGQSGLMKVRPGLEEKQPITVSRASDQILDFYRVVGLHSYGRPEILACAVRFGGVAATEYATGENGRIVQSTSLSEPISPEPIRVTESGQIKSVTFPGLDVVDVCSLGTGAEPPAVAAVGKNGTLLLFEDVLRDLSPVTLRFEDVAGTAYRVLSAQESIFLLTSTGLYIFEGLVRRFLQGEPLDQLPTPVRSIPLEAVDANLCGERWLLVVLPDQVLRIDTQLLVGNPLRGGEFREEGQVKPILFTPPWQSHRQAAELMAVS